MSNVSLGDLAQSLNFSRQGTGLKTSMQQLSTEVTTGLV
jgi:hypothetical protein